MATTTRDRTPVGLDWPGRLAEVCEDPSAVDVVLQPIVDLSRDAVAGYEALARLPGPGGPEPWFAAAARHGLAGPFESLVLERLLAQRSQLPVNTFLSINVTPAALVTAPVRSVFRHAGGLGGVVVEITEQSAVADDADLLVELDALRERGALVAVDDAGAGHATLSHVLRLRPDFVKLDRELVTGCDRDSARFALLEMLGSFADSIDAWVVAEGIERDGELDAVTRIGFPLAQGYHLGRPAARPSVLHPGTGARIASVRARRDVVDGLVALVSDAVVLDEHDEPAVRAVLSDIDAPRVVVLVDANGRPAGLRRPHEPSAVPVTATGLSDTPGSVARRAMARPRSQRFDPLVVCDDQGRPVGLVTVERLVAHLAA